MRATDTQRVPTSLRRPRMDCPDCDRNVSFVTDLEHKWLPRHRDPSTGRWCTARRLRVA